MKNKIILWPNITFDDLWTQFIGFEYRTQSEIDRQHKLTKKEQLKQDMQAMLSNEID